MESNVPKSADWTTGITFRHSDSEQQRKNNKSGQAGSSAVHLHSGGARLALTKKRCPETCPLCRASISKAAEEVTKLPRWHYPGKALPAAATGNISQEVWGGWRRAGKWRPLINLLQIKDVLGTISHRSLRSQLLLGLLCRVQGPTQNSEKLPLEMHSLSSQWKMSWSSLA